MPVRLARWPWAPDCTKRHERAATQLLCPLQTTTTRLMPLGGIRLDRLLVLAFRVHVLHRRRQHLANRDAMARGNLDPRRSELFLSSVGATVIHSPSPRLFCIFRPRSLFKQCPILHLFALFAPRRSFYTKPPSFWRDNTIRVRRQVQFVV